MELFGVGSFPFIYSVATTLLSCITERMHCDSPKLFLSLFLQPIEKLQLIYCRKVEDLLPTPPELDISHNTIWVHILSFAPLWPVDQSNGLSEAVHDKLWRLEPLSGLMVLGRFLIMGQFPLSDFSAVKVRGNSTSSWDQYCEDAW